MSRQESPGVLGAKPAPMSRRHMSGGPRHHPGTLCSAVRSGLNPI